MQLTLLSDGDVMRVACAGDITLNDFSAGDDPAGHDPFEQLLGPGCFQRRVLLDMGKATYVDSSGVGWLVVHHKHFTQSGGRLIVHSVAPQVEQTFQLLQLGRVLTIVPDEATALAVARK